MKKFLVYTIGVAIFAGFIWFSLIQNAGTCVELEAEAKAAIRESNYCDTMADCRAIAFGCPFGCEVLLNRDRADVVMAKVGRYHAHCMMICPDECPGESSALVCRQGECQRR